MSSEKTYLQLLVAIVFAAVSSLMVSCQSGGTSAALGSILDEMVTVNGRPFSQGMAQVGTDIKRAAGVPASSHSNDGRNRSSEQPSRSPTEEAERNRLRDELSRFRSNLAVGDNIIFYERLWLEREVIQVNPESVSVRWNSSFASAKRIDMEKVFPASWEVKTIMKTLDTPKIARARVDHDARTSSSAELDANYSRWKTAKADARKKASADARRQAVLDQARQEQRDRTTKTLYRCKKCGEEEFKTGQYQDLTPGGNLPCRGFFSVWAYLGKGRSNGVGLVMSG